jgi:FkbM family methyltransferase
MRNGTVPRLVEAAPITEIKWMAALQSLWRVAPLGHRLFPLLRSFVPDGGLISVPFCDRRLLYPAAWVGPFTAGHLLNIDGSFPERGLFQSTLASAGSGIIVDVGANLGVYMLLTRAVTDARVIGYEPSPLAFQVVIRMLQLNRLTGIEIRPNACGDTRGRACLQEGINSYVGGAVAAVRRDVDHFDDLCRQTRNGFTAIDVDQVTLDDDLAAEPDIALIKIDCEGFEQRVLLGARRLLADRRPTLFIELHPELIGQTGHSPAEVCGLLADCSYDVACWNFRQTRHVSRVTRVFRRYGRVAGHRYRGVGDMLADLPVSRPEQVYLIATPAERRVQ